jgi:SAM-dependent methyltransferase
MEGSSETERLERKTSATDTHQQLTTVGLAAGMTALDAGCGSGAVARVMADIVGPSGRVVGVDASLDRLRDGAALAAGTTPVRFCAASLGELPMRATFDLVWSRFVLEYLPDPERHLAELFRVVRPGGKLVVGDVDDHGLRHHPEPPLVTDGLARVTRALEGRFDPRMGRRLYHLVHRLDVEDIRVHLLPYHVYAGRASEDDLANWKTKWEVIRPVAVTAFDVEHDYDRFVEAFMAVLEDEEAFTYSTLVLVEARRPPDRSIEVGTNLPMGGAAAEFACELVEDDATEEACIEVLERVRRDELHRAGVSVIDSDVFSGATVAYELLAARAVSDGRVVGTIRITPAAALAGTGGVVQEYRLDVIDPALLDRSWILTRLALLPEVRGSAAGAEIYDSVYELALRRGIQLVLLSCEPNLVPLYEALGARAYGSVHRGTRGGFRLPMVFVTHDRDHFDALGSKFASVFDALVQDGDSSGIRWFEQLSASGIDTGLRRFDADRHALAASLLQGLTQEGRLQLLRNATAVTTQPGDMVIAHGDGSRSVGLVLEGAVDVRIDGRIVDRLGPGEVFGEIAFVLGTERTADVVTSEAETEIVLLSQHAYDRLTEPDDIRCAWQNLSRVLANRVLARTS